MELRHLRNFLAVVEQKSVSRAASLLRLAQPALSRQLHALERDLGTPLLTRHSWGVTATPEGEILAKHALTLLNGAQAARDAISAFSHIPSGKLAIGVPSSMASVLLPDLALAAQDAYPNIQLRLVEGYSANLHRQTLAGELDIAILYTEPRLPMLTQWPLLTEPLVAIGAPGIFESDTVSIQHLFDRPLLLPASSNRLRILFEDAAARAGMAHGVHMEVDSVPALIKLVMAGAGVSILPYSAIKAGVDQGLLSTAAIGPNPLSRSLVLARPSDRLETPAWRAIAGLLHDILKAGETEFGWKLMLPAEHLAQE